MQLPKSLCEFVQKPSAYEDYSASSPDLFDRLPQGRTVQYVVRTLGAAEKRSAN